MQSPSQRPKILAISVLIIIAMVWIGRPPIESTVAETEDAPTARQQMDAARSNWALHLSIDHHFPGALHKDDEVGADVSAREKVSLAGDSTDSDMAEKALRGRLEPHRPRLPFSHVNINGVAAHPDRVIARLDADTDVAEFQSFLKENNMRLLNDPAKEHGLAIIKTPAPHTGPDSGVAVVKQTKVLQTSGLCQFAEPDYVISSMDTRPSDRGFSDGWLWGLHNAGLWGGTSGMDIGALQAWETTTGSNNVTVAIVDTGIRATHHDLSANLWINEDEIAGNGVDDDDDGYVDNRHGIDALNNDGDPNDDNGHGTHVAGTIGASANNGYLHVGVAWQVRLMACKFLDADGSGYLSGAVRSIDFAVANGARVINCSWGSWGYSRTLYDAIENARNAGVLVVCAAGNSGISTDSFPHSPSAYDLDNIISVAAVDSRGHRPSWSNHGRDTVDVGAPGVSILSCTSQSDSGYAFWSGTSMAAPHVSGVAALMLADNPDLSLGELKDRILNTSRPLDSLKDVTVSGGMVQAHKALQGGGDGTLELAVTISDDPLKGGQTATLYARVTDVVPVLDATVTGTAGTESLTFADHDNDGVHTATFTVPADRSISTFTVNVSASAVGKTSAEAELDYFVIHSPSNDNFAKRSVLSGSTLTLWHYNNVGATAERGEPRHYYWRPRASIWFEWTAPYTGIAYLTTKGSDFDTVMAVYRGDRMSQLRRVARDDDSGGNLTSAVYFWAVRGRSYQIAVDGWDGAQGNVRGRLQLSRPWWRR